MNGKLSRIVVLLMVMAMLATTALPVAAAPLEYAASPAEKGPNIQFVPAAAAPVRSGIVVQDKNATGPALYIVQLTDAPLALYEGGIEGLEATRPATRGEKKLNLKSDASKAYLAYLDQKRAGAIEDAEKALGRALDVVYEYKATLFGYAAEMTPEEARIVAALPGVKLVERERTFELETDAGPGWIGAPGIWDGSMTGGLPGTYGEGVIVGVIDTGIDPWNPSFADVGDDGYDHTNPWGEGNYVGVCDPDDPGYDPTFACNDKLIGARGYVSVNGGDPRDADGHGSHTSSTAAGNFVNDATITTNTGTWMADISGVAPHANIIMYAACCTSAALNAARDDAAMDGVDVINYSIGSTSPTADPWTSTEEQQWLALRDLGVFVATSAGNSGPGNDTVGSPGDVPWITTVGASSHNRAFLNSLTLDDGVNPPLTVEGMAIANGVGPVEIVQSRDFVVPPATEEDARLCAPGAFPPGTFDGQIVICERGQYARVGKGQSVLDGGAGGYVLAQPNEFGGGPGAVAMDPHVLPAIHIDWYAYQQVLDYFANAAGPVMGTISDASLDYNDAHADIMAAFSSRGANRSLGDILKPDVTAPGRGIWAAYHQGEGGDGDYTFNVIQGTSMSSPHVAGAGALMKALHPDWSPAEIQSALMTTANTDVLNDDGVNKATPFAQGSGRVDLGYAAQAGLVLDVTTDEYVAANPAEGGDPKALNLANMANDACVEQCGWTRTVSSTLDVDMDWNAALVLPDGMTGTVTPETFTLPAGGTQDIEVNVNVSGLPMDEWAFAELQLTPVTKAASAAHLPIAVMPSVGDLPDLVKIVTARDAGSRTVPDLVAVTIDDLTIETLGLDKGTQYDISLFEDPTNGDPYDNLDDVWWMTFDVPEGTSRIVAETTYSAAPDIDLFWGTGDTPSADTQIGASTTSSWVEYLNAWDPPAGTYWVLLQSWNGSDNQPDDMGLSLAVVGGDAGNMAIDGPAAVPPGTPFDLQLFWNEDMNAGERWYGSFTIGSGPASPGNIGRIDVNLLRVGDDVTKTASTDEAFPGDVVEYTITVEPNITDVDLTYTITDTIPDGMTYVPDSAWANFGDVQVVDNTVMWTGVMEVPSATYDVSTSDTDPACVMPLATDGAYIDLEAYGILAQAGVEGDTVAYTWDPSGGAFDLFGKYQGQNINFTDDGFAFFDPSTPGATPWTNQPIPTADDPNNLMAFFWRDMEIVYDEAANRGVSLANLTSGGIPQAALMEFDDVEDWPAGTTGTTYDVELLAYYDPAPGRPEYIFAYNNLNGNVITGTIGLENKDGSDGVQVAFNDIDVTDGMAICFDLVGAAEPATITYLVTVDEGVPAGTELTNQAVHVTDEPGAMPDVASTTITVLEPPVPTVVRSRRYNVSMDTFIDGSRPAANFGGASTMWVGFEDLMRPVVKADIPICDDVVTCIPSDATVDKAYLYVYVTEGRGFGQWSQSVIAEVSAHAVLSDWAENTATWNTPWAAPGGDIGPMLDSTHLGSGKIGTWLRFDVTDAVADIISGNMDNNGFALTSWDPVTLGNEKAIKGVRYGLASQEYWDPSKVGYLRVMYRTFTKLEGADLDITQ